MKRRCLFSLLLAAGLAAAAGARAQSFTDPQAPFRQAKAGLEAMLSGQEPLCYERAVFLMENAWFDGGLDSTMYRLQLDEVEAVVQALAVQKRAAVHQQPYDPDPLERAMLNPQEYGKAATQLAGNAAIYSYLKDTAFLMVVDSFALRVPRQAYTYSRQDPFGTADWLNTGVLHLLATRQGNCFALASLYKILADRLQTGAALCTMPGHIFIRHTDERSTPHNVELSGGGFPGTGTLQAWTHTPDAAVVSGLAMRNLNNREAVAICLVYLAKGYEHKTGRKADSFAFACAESALQYDSLCLSALLLKSEVLETRLFEKGKTGEKIWNTPDFLAYQEHVRKLFRLGYREMPLEAKNLLVRGLMRDTTQRRAEAIYHGPLRTLKGGQPATRYASLSWGLLDEEMRDKPVEQYGRTLFDTKTQTIARFSEQRPLYNEYSFDPVVFAWNVDPLAHKAPGVSPYAFCENSPILHLDPDGRFKQNYNEKTLAENGLSKLQMQRFENIMQNVGKLLQNNPQALDAVVKTTGFSKERILNDFKPGQGPGIDIGPTMTGARGGASGITFDPSIVKTLASISPQNKAALANQVLGVALTIAHEYGHYGDETTNGVRSGQYLNDGRNVYFEADGSDPGAKRIGSQGWKVSVTGHRGTDIEVMGFGVKTSNDNGTIEIEKAQYNGSAGTSPSQLPENLQGENVLNTMQVR